MQIRKASRWFLLRKVATHTMLYERAIPSMNVRIWEPTHIGWAVTGRPELGLATCMVWTWRTAVCGTKSKTMLCRRLLAAAGRILRSSFIDENH